MCGLWTTDLNVRDETPGRKGGDAAAPGSGRDSLNGTLVTQEINIMDRWDFMKLKSFYMQGNSQSIGKTIHRIGRKLCQLHI